MVLHTIFHLQSIQSCTTSCLQNIVKHFEILFSVFALNEVRTPSNNYQNLWALFIRFASNNDIFCFVKILIIFYSLFFFSKGLDSSMYDASRYNRTTSHTMNTMVTNNYHEKHNAPAATGNRQSKLKMLF